MAQNAAHGYSWRGRPSRRGLITLPESQRNEAGGAAACPRALRRCPSSRQAMARGTSVRCVPWQSQRGDYNGATNGY
jgi:hypothetical protein